MTIAENITDAISFAGSLGDVCLVVAIIGCTFMLMASACVLRFPGDHPARICRRAAGHRAQAAA